MPPESFNNFFKKIEAEETCKEHGVNERGRKTQPESKKSSRKPSQGEGTPFERAIERKLLESAESLRTPYMSNIEEEARQRLRGMDRVSGADLDQEVERVFSGICGEHGRKEFFQYTVPAIKQVYGTNYRKAGLRLVEIIDKGAESKPSEIGAYFKEAVSQAELGFSKKNKDEVVKDLEERIEKAILEFRGRYGERYKGVVGAIVFGSYAKGNFHLGSDLDIIYVTKSRNRGMRISPYQDEFDDWLNRKVKPVVKSDIYDPIAMSDVGALRDLTGDGSMVGEGYIVISPYPGIKKAIHDALASSSQGETI